MYVMNLTNGKLKVEESKQLKLLIKQVKKLKKLSKKPKPRLRHLRNQRLPASKANSLRR